MAGRPLIYTEGLADIIVERLINGESLNRICKDTEMPSRQTVYNWLGEDNHPFFDKYARAKNVQTDSRVDELEDLCDKAIADPSLVQAIKLKIETRKWVASKLVPKKYGDRQQIEHTTIDEHGESTGINFE